MNKSKDLIKVINIYLLLTIAYYLFGRYNWDIPSATKLISYLMLLIVAMNIGYYTKRIVLFKNRKIQSFNNNNYLSNKIRMLFKISCLVIIVYQIVWVITFLGSFDVTNVLSSLGENYYERLSFTNDDSVFIMQIRTLFWGLTLFAYPIGFTYYRQLKISEKMLFISTLSVDILASLNMGVSKNIGDIVLIYILCVLVSKNGKHLNSSFIKSYIKRYRKILVLVLTFAVVFGVIQGIRDSASGTSIATNPYNDFSTLREYTVFDILTFGNHSMGSVTDKLGAYISHGYTGLAYALELPFQQTYGLGFSRALMDYADQYLDVDAGSKTYMARTEAIYGWPDGMYWSTAYTWFASAFSFWLLPLVMYLFGYALARVESRFKICGDVFSLALLSQLFIMAIYLPANAQIFQARPSLFGTVLLIFVYLCTGRRYRY